MNNPVNDDEDRSWCENVAPDAADRCQAVMASGQCRFRVMFHNEKPLKYCKMHGSAQTTAIKKEVKRLYNLQKYKEQVSKFDQESPNLDEELGIQRFVLEELMNKFEGVELITQSGRITQLVREIRETMLANLKMKSALGQLLDRLTIAKLCDAIVLIAQKHVPATAMDAFAADVAGEIAKAVNSRINQ